MGAGTNPQAGATAAAGGVVGGGEAGWGGSRLHPSCCRSHHLPPTRMSLAWEGPKCHPQLEQGLSQLLPCKAGRTDTANELMS